MPGISRSRDHAIIRILRTEGIRRQDIIIDHCWHH